MTSPEFLDWAASQSKGRYELVDGEVIAMSPERARHVIVKANVFRSLQDAIRNGGLPCSVFADGISVVINDKTTYEPEATVQCGVTVDLDSMVVEEPMIVVEVTSPSSEVRDHSSKLADYFTLPSIVHVLIVDPVKKLVIQHSRGTGADLLTRILRDGDITLDPPRVVVPVASFFVDV
ncbi:MAG: Uma2 family endonuclease [Hyphomicrobium sp.]